MGIGHGGAKHQRARRRRVRGAGRFFAREYRAACSATTGDGNSARIASSAPSSSGSASLIPTVPTTERSAESDPYPPARALETSWSSIALILRAPAACAWPRSQRRFSAASVTEMACLDLRYLYDALCPP